MKERADAPRLVSIWVGLEITASSQQNELITPRLSGKVIECTITEVIERKGPAIVEEFGSTTVVFPGQNLTVDPHGVLIIKAGGKSARS